MSTELPEALVERFLRSLRNQFYKGEDKLFFQERRLLMAAICYPAQWLDQRAVRLNAKRYTDILTKIIRAINAHGQLSTVRSMGRYLAKCVQEHMSHHGDAYYEEAKATRNVIDDVLLGLGNRVQKGAAIPATDSTVPDLAKLHRLLGAKKPRRKTAATPMQKDLFTPAKPVKPRRA